MADNDKNEWWKRWGQGKKKDIALKKKVPVETRIEWIEHKGKVILKNDLSDLSDKELAEQMIKYEKIIFDNNKTDIRVFSDVTNFYFIADSVSDSLTEVQRIAASTKPFISKYAVIGIGGIKSILFIAVKPFATADLVLFKTIEEAKDWLIK